MSAAPDARAARRARRDLSASPDARSRDLSPRADDGPFDGLILPRDDYLILYRLSYISLLSGVVALLFRHYDLCVAPFSVCATSTLYWRRPDYGFRRALDVTVVHAALAFQLWRAREAEHGRYYYAITGVGAVAFLLGVLAYRRGAVRLSTLLHGAVHVLANAANLVLYVGRVPPLW